MNLSYYHHYISFFISLIFVFFFTNYPSNIIKINVIIFVHHNDILLPPSSYSIQFKFYFYHHHHLPDRQKQLLINFFHKKNIIQGLTIELYVVMCKFLFQFWCNSCWNKNCFRFWQSSLSVFFLCETKPEKKCNTYLNENF